MNSKDACKEMDAFLTYTTIINSNLQFPYSFHEDDEYNSKQ